MQWYDARNCAWRDVQKQHPTPAAAAAAYIAGRQWPHHGGDPEGAPAAIADKVIPLQKREPAAINRPARLRPAGQGVGPPVSRKVSIAAPLQKPVAGIVGAKFSSDKQPAHVPKGSAR